VCAICPAQLIFLDLTTVTFGVAYTLSSSSLCSLLYSLATSSLSSNHVKTVLSEMENNNMATAQTILMRV
jgi:hypothetical protein